MKIRFCLYEFAESEEEIRFKKKLFAECNLCKRSEFHELRTTPNLSDISVTTLREGGNFIKSYITDQNMNSKISPKDWICISETIVWEDLGEKLFIISSFHRRQFKLYSIICAQLLRQLSMDSSANTHISCNTLDPSQTDKVIDIDLPRFYPLMNRYHSFTPINRSFFSNFHACIFGDETKCFMRDREINYLSSRRTVVDIEKRIPCKAYQKATMQVKRIVMPNVDPIYEELMQYLYRDVAQNHGKAITSGGSVNIHGSVFQKSVLECIAELESPVQMFGDTSQGVFRKRLSTILKMIENEDDLFKGCTSKTRRFIQTPIPHDEFYYLSQISHFIEEPERLVTLSIPKTDMFFEVEYACSKLVANMENTDRFCNYWVASELRRCVKVIENMLNSLNLEKLNTKQIEAIKRLLSRIVESKEQVIGSGDIVMLNVFSKPRSFLGRLKFWKHKDQEKKSYWHSSTCFHQPHHHHSHNIVYKMVRDSYLPAGRDETYGKATESAKSAVVSPLSKLTPEQTKLMGELRKIAEGWDLDEEQKAFMDEMCLFRYLSGLQWNMDQASKQLKETMEWRKTFRPQDIRLKDLEPIAKQGFLFHYGYDKQCRPVIYVLMGKDTADNTEENKKLKFKLFVYMMEKCIKRMPEGVHNIVWLVDLKDSSLSMSLVKEMKDTFVQLGNYYTERLARTLVLNAGWTISMIWSFVSNFLAKETVEKYVMVKGNDKTIAETFEKYIEKDLLVKGFGNGTAEYKYDIAQLIKEEIEDEEELRKREQ
ncbi:hypothetical protein C9374_008114 [Naegleria lovaniensis]|uniref:CRAL-TRIO domain-containing protein n=1 Tax=Naegleria lovaniensis TaxID=51637 RepID=A0AA88KGA9_NAELO|nr:uncharacterized protein C9374_008114 [Naegleria lovaniensis]KAG2378475.1 hypothetical protein C9374_008114 [Naegleria lovaniensis]